MVRFQLVWITFCAGCLVNVCSVGSGATGPPYKPEDVRVSVKKFSSRWYYVYWKVPRNASSESDSVNVSYTVRFRNLSSCYEQRPDVQYACRLSRHRTAAFDEFECKVKTTSSIFNAYCDYNVSVLARSSFGEVESSVVPGPRSQDLPTPLPPRKFDVHPTENHELKVEWKSQGGWLSYNVVYIILYHANGELSNKSARVKNELHTTLTVEPFKTYWVYLRAVVVSDGTYNVSSDVIGPRIVFTPAGDPESGPDIVSHESQKLPDPAFRNVTIHWQEPSLEAWRGDPGYYLVHYSMHNLKRNFSMSNATVLNVTDTQLNKTVLVQVQSGQNYIAFMEMCNTAGKCARGQEYPIKALPTNNKQLIGGEQGTALIIIIVVSVIIIIAVVVASAVCYRKRWSTHQDDPSTDLDDLEVQMCPDYQDVDNDERNEYD